MFTRAFWVATLERSIRGGAIAASAALGTVSFADVADAVNRLEVAGLGFGFGFLMSGLLSLGAGALSSEKGTPSFTTAETIAEPGAHEAD